MAAPPPLPPSPPLPRVKSLQVQGVDPIWACPCEQSKHPPLLGHPFLHRPSDVIRNRHVMGQHMPGTRLMEAALAGGRLPPTQTRRSLMMTVSESE
eukprot:364439-Chlamydomonas_euryale.AAC.15